MIDGYLYSDPADADVQHPHLAPQADNQSLWC